MITLLLLMPIVALFIVTNIVVGCYLAIQLGYGPPNWQTALNLVIRVTALQDHLNECRDWIDSKSARTEKFLNRLHVPKPIIIVDVTDLEESDDDSYDEQIGELVAIPIEELLSESKIEPPQSTKEPIFYDDSLAAAMTNSSTDTWFVNDKNAETSLLKLNFVLMKSGRFAAELENKIRASLGTMTAEILVNIFASFKEDCQNYLVSQSEIAKEVSQRIDEFGEFKALAEEVVRINSVHVAIIESVLKDIDALADRPPKEGAAWLLQELIALRLARHQLRDMRERVFTFVAAKENRIGTIPKQLYVDALSGLRGRIGLVATLYDWWKHGRQKGRFLTFALVDFVKFGELNDNHGILAGDKIIKQFGNVLKERFDAGDLFGIYYGNAFLIVTVNAGMQKTVTTIERIRQKQMKTVYQVKDVDVPIQVLLTGAIVETTGEQSVEEVLTKLDQTMAAAKSAGRNHTFCWNDKATQPEKTESPDFDEQPQNIVLE